MAVFAFPWVDRSLGVECRVSGRLFTILRGCQAVSRGPAAPTLPPAVGEGSRFCMFFYSPPCGVMWHLTVVVSLMANDFEHLLGADWLFMYL